MVPPGGRHGNGDGWSPNVADFEGIKRCIVTGWVKTVGPTLLTTDLFTMTALTTVHSTTTNIRRFDKNLFISQLTQHGASNTTWRRYILSAAYAGLRTFPSLSFETRLTTRLNAN